MPLLPNYLRRTTAILKMPQAIAKGMSANAFLAKLRLTTGGYTRQKFLGDWRSISGMEKKKDAMKYVRRDRRPPASAMADVEWDSNPEYMFKMRSWVRVNPGDPMTERFVNITSDRNLTPDEQVAEVFDRWTGWEKYSTEELVKVDPVAGYHNILSDAYMDKQEK